MDEATITTTRGTRVRVDADLQPVLERDTWYQYANGRAYRRPAGWKGPAELLHRVVAGVTQGNLRVLFRNGDPTDCRRENLEVVHQSRINRGPRRSIPPWRGSSRFRGVGWHKKSRQWQAFIRHPETRRVECLGFWPGTSQGEIRAAERHDERARELHGEAALLNFGPPLRGRRPRASAAAAAATAE